MLHLRMQFNKYFGTGIFFACSFFVNSAHGQGLMLRNLNDESRLVDRYEILSGELSTYFYGTHKNIGANAAAKMLHNLDSNKLTKIDHTNINNIFGNNQNALAGIRRIEASKKPILKHFYTTPNNFISYTADDGSFGVQINPIVNYTQLQENNNAENVFINQKGVDVSASILNKVFLYTQLTETQERNPVYNSGFINKVRAVPGAGYIKEFKGNGWDYSLAKGYISADFIPNVVNVTFGHDQFFIGDGYRSLFLSDFGTNMLFLKTNWHFWKVYYQTNIMELNALKINPPDAVLPKKYAAMHHLGLRVNSKLNIGLFEAVISGRKDHFDFQYLNPVIFYRTVEQQVGSPDNANLGLDFKYLPVKNIQLYGQLMLDEFRFSDVLSGNKSWANKQAYQLGAKYINAFGIKNLDVQIEHNNIRPYTYSYKDSIAEYSHYNKPLAHPNGANLREQILVVHYQPTAKLQLSAETIYRKQGMDTSANYSFGGDIFKNYNLHGADTGHDNLSGLLQTTFFTNLHASYQVLRNLNIDAGLIYRNATLGNAAAVASNTIYVGARLNASRRKYNY
jgi:hypothetical protein